MVRKAILLGLALVSTALAGVAGPVEVRVRQTDGGPRMFVDGKAVRPRFYYGSPACLCNISSVEKRVFEIPFRAEADTDQGQLAMDGYAGDDPMWFSNLRLVDVESGVTNVIAGVEEERTRHYRKGGIRFRKGRLYRFLITHRATHFRTYFTNEVSYLAPDGRKVVLPLPYGDTLGDTAALAAGAGVDLVTFSTDSSWGCEGWWGEKDGEENYRKLDLACERLIRANPRILFVPRVKADAPEWLLAQRPELRMKFANGMTVKMSSVSSRFYRREACRQVEMLARHLRAKFPRNFAGLHVSGQNSAEWFYMMSDTRDASGYDVATRDAFRTWLAARGEPNAATAEVPGDAERRTGDANGLRDPEKDRRAILFHRFRQEEMASLLSEIGAAIRRGSDGKVLSLFFYGYAWELGAVELGAPETGHYGLEWLLGHGKENVDGISAPISYSNRRWPGSAPVMSAAESIQRAGILWIDEDDNRTHHEDIWDHMGWDPHHDPWQTRNDFLRDSAVQILRGYGDWWMDLFGRGWFRDREVWDVRRALNPLDDAMLKRTRPYTPEIAVCVNEESFLYCAAGSGRVTGPALNRRGFEACGVMYGQYLLNDVLTNPPPAKVFYLAVANNLTAGQRTKLAALKVSRPDAVFVENVRAEDVTPEAIAATALRAGAHAYVRPGAAYVTAAEGYVSVFARTEGPIEVDFGTTGKVFDFLTGAAVGAGPKLTLPFRKGETRIFRCDVKMMQCGKQ